MEQKEGAVFFLKLLIFPIEKEICINWKHFGGGVFCLVFFFTDCHNFFLIIFSPNFLIFFFFFFLKDLSKRKGGGKIFFLFFLLFFCEQRVGIDHFLAVVLSAVIALWGAFNVCLFRHFPATAFRILKEN